MVLIFVLVVPPVDTIRELAVEKVAEMKRGKKRAREEEKEEDDREFELEVLKEKVAELEQQIEELNTDTERKSSKIADLLHQQQLEVPCPPHLSAPRP